MSIFNSRDKKRRDRTDAADGMLVQIWEEYREGQAYQDQFDIPGRLEDCFRFYEGDQWTFRGQSLQTGGEKYPIRNFIEPIVNQKVGTICMNSVGVSFSPAGLVPEEDKERALEICKAMEAHVRLLWESFRLDVLLWDYMQEAAVGGMVCVYLDHTGRPALVDQTNLFLGDEQETDIQRQPYVIIRERLSAKAVRQEARKNGVDEDELRLIVPDEDTTRNLGDMAKTEIKTRETEGKCTVLLRLWRGEDGNIHFLRCTKDVMVQAEKTITGLSRYPLAVTTWKKRKGSARGRGEVEDMIAAQIEVNKNLARRIFASKQSAFPRIAYDMTAIQNPDALQVVGAPIAIDGNARQVGDMIQYLQPMPVSGDAKELGRELIDVTRELHQSGDAVMGNINPEAASGASIVAAKNQAEIPLNSQRQAYKDLVESIARDWVDLAVAYNPNGLTTYLTQEDGSRVAAKITGDELQKMQLHLRVDVSNVNPVSKLASEQSLAELMQAGKISFEEFVHLLDDDSTIPKAKLEDILEKREAEPPTQEGAPTDMPAAGMQGIPALPGGQATQERDLDTLQAMLAG